MLVPLAQAVACRDASPRPIAAAVTATPASASVSSPLHVGPAASVLSPHAARELEGALWLDVRTRAERSQGYLTGTRLVPLDELAARVDELRPWEHRPIVLVCASGKRAGEAAALLGARGFTRLHVLEGGMLAWGGPVAAPRLDADGPDFPERFRLGLSLVVVRDDDDDHPRVGLEVHTVYPGGAAHGRLLPGEVITAIDGVPLDDEALRRATHRRLFPRGKPLALRVIDRGGGERTEILGAVHSPPFPPPTLPPARSSSPLGATWQPVAEALGSPEGLAFGQAFRLQNTAWLPSASPLAGALLLDPASLGMTLDMPPFRSLSGHETPHEALTRSLQEARRLLPPAPPPPPVPAPPQPAPTAPIAPTGELREALRALARRALQGRALARSALPRGWAEQDSARAERLRGELERRVFVHDVPERDRRVELMTLMDDGQRFQAARCLDGARSLGGVLEAGALSALRAATAGAPELAAPDGMGVEGAVLGWLDTPEGRIVVGGRGNNTYKDTYLAIVDTGGDDRYELKAGGEPTLLLDLEGDDRYELEDEEGSPWAPGRALLLADLTGNDVYRSTGSGLAAGYFSASVLLDAEGDDRYEARRGGLGAGRFGAGLLLDLGGRDRYVGGRGSEGFGGPGGVGLLYDQGGDDRYDVEPTEGVDHPNASLAQGCGMGIRELSYGGVGVLLDTDGDDRYSGRNYAQGVGYFGGLGLLDDRRGNDAYEGRLYAQGAGVHAAVGLLVDGAGDDRYRLVGEERGQGIAWDLALAALVDTSGDDSFEAPGMAQGYGAQNGLALLITGASAARRRCDDEAGCGGRSGPNDYAGGRGTRSFAWHLRRPRASQ